MARPIITARRLPVQDAGHSDDASTCMVCDARNWHRANAVGVPLTTVLSGREGERPRAVWTACDLCNTAAGAAMRDA